MNFSQKKYLPAPALISITLANLHLETVSVGFVSFLHRLLTTLRIQERHLVMGKRQRTT